MADLDRARQVARFIRDGDMDVIGGCRAMVEYRGLIDGVPDDVWDVIVGVESETDDVPLGDVRKEWDPQALARKLADAETYLEHVRPMVREACARILTALGG